jgi:hypothetical protein
MCKAGRSILKTLELYRVGWDGAECNAGLGPKCITAMVHSPSIMLYLFQRLYIVLIISAR